MVTRISNNTNVDLSNAIDNYGVENDFVYIVTSVGNRYSTYAGNDVIDASKAVASFITEIYAGTGDDQVTGSSATDHVYDGLGNDTVTLGAGDDRLFVDGGNDIYYGGAGTDTLDFRYFNVLGYYNGSGGGAETNDFGVKFDLALNSVQDLGILGFDQFFGFENAYGSAGSDKFSGSAGANFLQGADGNDVLDGRGGNDTLEGGMGIDYLIGGAGTDKFDLGSGELIASRDFVRFSAITDSTLSPATMDVIDGFMKGAAVTADRIDLALIDANAAVAGNQAFIFRGTGNFTSAAGEVRYVVSGGNTTVYVDTDADAAAEMAFVVHGVQGLSAIDFLL